MRNNPKIPSIILQPIVGYISSSILLLFIFIKTMLLHYNGRIDWDYLGFASIRIFIISIVPAIAIRLLNIRKWYLSIVFGLVLGLITAVIVVNVMIRI